MLESVAEQVRQVANAIEAARSRAGVDQPSVRAGWTGRSAIQAADGLRALGPAFRFVTDALYEASRAARSSSAVLRDGQAEARNLRAQAYWLGEQIARLEYSDAIDDRVGNRLDDARSELTALRHRLWELVARVARVEAGAAAALASIPSAYWGPVRGRAGAGSTIAEYANLWFETRGGTLLWTLDSMSPTDQLARWNSLTRDEREVLITRYPAQVTAMPGLPQSDRDRAELILLDVIGNGVPVLVDSLSAEARLSLKVWSFGVHGSATMTQTADGKVSVALEGGADIGIGRRFDEGEASGSVEVRVGAQGRTVYDFRSIEGATAFIAALTSALPSPDAVKKVASKPQRFDGSHSDTIYTVKDQAVASAKLGSLIEAEAALGTIVEYSPTTGIMALSTAFALDARVTLPTNRGGQVITGNVDVAAALTQTIGPAGVATTARVEVTAGAGTGLGIGLAQKAGISATLTSGRQTTVSLDLDLDNPRTRATFEQLVTGDLALTDAFERLTYDAKVVVTQAAVSHVDMDFDSGIIEAEIDHAVTTATKVAIKPASSSTTFVLCRPDADAHSFALCAASP